MVRFPNAVKMPSSQDSGERDPKAPMPTPSFTNIPKNDLVAAAMQGLGNQLTAALSALDSLYQRNPHAFIRKVRDELASIRREVEETAVEPVVVGPSGYADQDAGPPVVLGRLPCMVIMIDPRDAGL